MKLKIYKIYCLPNHHEHCSAIAFSKRQAEEYCKSESSYREGLWIYEEEEIDTKHALECSIWRKVYCD